MKIAEIFNCKNDEWGTPTEFFNELDSVYNFTLDPCANPTRLLKKDMISITKAEDGLKYDWIGHRVFCNPPYSKNNFMLWCEKINKERKNAQVIVLLCPLRRCSTKYFHELVLDYAELKIVKGRLNFTPLIGQSQASNPTGSALCFIDNRNTKGGRG